MIADIICAEPRDEAQRISVQGPSFGSQEDPEQQLSDATQLRSNMYHFAVPAADVVTGTPLHEGRDSSTPTRLARNEKLQKRCY